MLFIKKQNKSKNKDSSHLICHIIYRLDIGGLENGLVNLINNLPAERYQHAIICLTYATEFKYRIQRQDVKIIEIFKKEGKDLHAYIRVWHAIRALNPDIVHTRNIASLDMIISGIFANVSRFVHSEHGLDIAEITGKHYKYNLMRRISNLVVSHYIAVSRDLADWLKQEIHIPTNKVSLIYNGVNTKLFKSGPIYCELLPDDFKLGEKVLIGTIGRLQPIKDQATLAKAFVILLNKHPQFRDKLRLIIVGDGNMRSEIQQILKNGGVENFVWFSGFITNTVDLYRSIDLFVLPSRREGISNTILEAMSTGLPVVATSVGGNTEIVQDNVTGRIVSAENPNEMAEVLLEYIKNPNLIKIHGEAGRQLVKNKFSLEIMLQKYDQIYQSLY